MDPIVTQVVQPFQPVFSDARLVLFADDSIQRGDEEVMAYLVRCAKYAMKYKVYLASGLLVHDNQLCLSLFAPDGKAICRQPALHLAVDLRDELRVGENIEVVDTELGKLALCVDEDALSPQVARTAAMKGARILLSVQQVNPLEDTPQRIRQTAWNMAQTNGIYVIAITSKGVTVTCPANLNRARDGVLLQQTSIYPVRFGLNLERLEECRAQLPVLERINVGLAARYGKQLGGIEDA